MKKRNTNYVSTTLEQFLNESRNITLTRKYGKNEPVVVSSKAPIRNKVLQYVAENQKVTKNSLKKFIVSLNENNANPSSVSMWMKRNEQYFLNETKNGVTTYKLSNLGKKLVSSIALNEGCNCGGTNVIKKPTSTTKVKKRVFENEDTKKEEEWPDDKQRTHDFEDHGEEGIYDEQNEDSYEGAKRVIESIKARRVFESAEDEEVEDEEVEDEEVEDEFGDDDKVEITEFVLSVDDAESAIAELAELGITAERVTSEDEEISTEDDEFGEPTEDEELPAEDEELPAEDEELPAEDDFDLGDLGDIEGEDTEDAEVAESMNEDDETPAEDDEFGTPAEDEELPAEDDEFGTPAEDEELPAEDDEFGEPAEDEELPAEDDEFGAPEFDNNQIKVSAENWGALKGWLESKGVDTKELFGGDIVEEGEDEEDDSVEEEIDFDSLENLEEYEDDKTPSNKKESKPKEDAEDEDEDEESEDKKDGKKWNFEK